MNVKRFTARTSREALALVRQAFGDDAVVMSTRPCAEGVEVLAMAPESVQQLERVGMTAQENLGHPACLLVPDLIRAPMARLLKRAAPRLKVLGHSEIPETHSIRIGSIIGSTA